MKLFFVPILCLLLTFPSLFAAELNSFPDIDLNSNDINNFDNSKNISSSNPTISDKFMLDLSNSVRSLLAGNETEGLGARLKNTITQEGVGVTKSFLEKFFPTVEISYSTGLYNKPTAGILVVAPLSDKQDIKNTVFTQISTFYTDNRTTLNLGLGYRRLEFDNKLLLGANLFYDHEFPYDHQRTSFGLEARTSVGEINFNEYWGISGWKEGRNNFEEKSLGGRDIEIGVPLPYMNWVKFYARGFKWNGIEGESDIKGNDLSLQANLNGLTISAGKRNYNDLKDSEFLQISYNLINDNPPQKLEWISKEAYKFQSMENRRYDKVRRENIIVKQVKTGFSVIVKGT